MRYAIALIMLSAGLALGYAAGWYASQPSKAEQKKARHFEEVARASRSVNANAFTEQFARVVPGFLGDDGDVEKALESIRGRKLVTDLTNVFDKEIGACVSWEYRVCPDGASWKAPDPGWTPGAETYDLVWAQFTFADGWVYTAVYNNWKSARGTWDKDDRFIWHQSQQPAWFERALVWKGVPKSASEQAAETRARVRDSSWTWLLVALDGNGPLGLSTLAKADRAALREGRYEIVPDGQLGMEDAGSFKLGHRTVNFVALKLQKFDELIEQEKAERPPGQMLDALLSADALVAGLMQSAADKKARTLYASTSIWRLQILLQASRLADKQQADSIRSLMESIRAAQDRSKGSNGVFEVP